MLVSSSGGRASGLRLGAAAPAPVVQRDGPSRPDPRVDRGAIIRGRVVSLETGRPIKRVNVTASSVGMALPARSSAATNAEGRFELRGLPPGRYRLVATKEGFVTTAFGQRGLVESWRPFDIDRSDTVENVEILLPRGGVIMGRVLDEDGVAFPEVAVSALQYRLVAGRRRLVAARDPALTNDLGEFRLFGLQPGDYYVTATYRAASGDPTDGAGGTGAYVPMYFPSTFAVPDAQRIVVKATQEATADFQLVPMRGKRIAGAATADDGAALVRGIVRMRVAADAIDGDVRTTALGADGSFRFSGVAPGTYALTAIGGKIVTDVQAELPDAIPPQEIAYASVTVSDQDVDSVQLQAVPAGTIRGRLRFDAPVRPSDLQAARVICGPSGPDSAAPGSHSTGVRADGFFELRDVFGPCVMGAFAPGWNIRTITRGEDELVDRPLDIPPGRVTDGVEVLLTNTETGIDGAVVVDAGALSPDFVVVVVPADQGAWRFPSRRIRAARPNQHGRFRISGLPAGNYLALALAYGDETVAQDFELLERLRPSATSVAVSEGAMRTVLLKLLTDRP